MRWKRCAGSESTNLAKAKLTVEGIEALQKRLSETLPSAIREEMGEAMIRAARRVVRDASAVVPRDSGTLASTIRHTEPRIDKKGALYVAIVAGGTKTEVGAENNYQLARIIEFGAQGRDPEPFFLPAWRRNKRGIRSALSRALNKATKVK